jgi:tRNA(adenine34) deaminase
MLRSGAGLVAVQAVSGLLRAPFFSSLGLFLMSSDSPLATPDTAPGLPAEVPLDERDGRYLRQAIGLADLGRSRGNRPFGAVLVSPSGDVMGEAWCNTTETGDCTGHAETSLVRAVSPRYTRDVLAQATLYSSGEPCVMCAGAIYWSNIRRVVYGIDAWRLRAFRGERLDQRDAELSCRDVFEASPYAIECIGPALIEEASRSHVGAWKV